MRSERQYIQRDVEDFLRWVNSDGKIQPIFRRMIEITVERAEKIKKLGGHEASFLAESRMTRRGLAKSVDAIYGKEIDRLLRKLRTVPTRVVMHSYRTADGAPVFGRVPARSCTPEDREICRGLDLFIHFTSEGAVADLRHCKLKSCGRFFYPLRSDAEFCTALCQRTFYRKGSTWKKNHASFQRTYYREYLSAEAKRMQKLAARRGLSHLPLSALKKRLGKG